MTPSETLFLRRQDGFPNDVARLKGRRFVAAIESEENRRLAESKVKSLTGGDTITARFMRGEWFEFHPEFKLFLVTNHLPRVRGTDRAIWRRMRLIPFNYVIPKAKRDRDLKRKLIETELPGILRSVVLGCLEWQEGGLQPPDVVRFATDEYRESEDLVGRSIEEWGKKGAGFEAPARPLYISYRTWAIGSGEHPLTQTAFGKRLTELGFKKRKTNTGWIYEGIGIRVDR
jgi:putative DNA primase/helicase